MKRFQIFCATVFAAIGLISAPASADTVLLVQAEGAPTSSLVQDVLSKIQGTGLFTAVDVFDARTGTPSLATLQNYDAVFVWSDVRFADRNALGDNLHNYALAGGGVVTAVFANTNPGSLDIGGLYASNGDAPIISGPQSAGTRLTLGTISEPASPLVAGVTAFDAGAASYITLGAVKSGATVVASYQNGRPLIVRSVIGSQPTVSLNFWPVSGDATGGSGWVSSTNGARIIANALSYVANPPPPPAAIPTMSEWAMIILGTMLAGGAALYIQRRKQAV